jgi:hypothetical protein
MEEATFEKMNPLDLQMVEWNTLDQYVYLSHYGKLYSNMG